MGPREIGAISPEALSNVDPAVASKAGPEFWKHVTPDQVSEECFETIAFVLRRGRSRTSLQRSSKTSLLKQ